MADLLSFQRGIPAHFDGCERFIFEVQPLVKGADPELVVLPDIDAGGRSQIARSPDPTKTLRDVVIGDTIVVDTQLRTVCRVVERKTAA